jgi:hypothetical protein
MAVITSLEIETRLQERLDAPSIWKEVCEVKYTDTGTIKNPYLTDATLGSGTRGTAYTSTAVATNDSSVSITDYAYAAQHIDDADLAQASFSDHMEIVDNMATVLDEGMMTAMLEEHAQWTNFDNSAIGGGAGNITVQVSNIKNIITGIKREIREAKGGTVAARNGMFIVWREADFELVEQLASSEGFSTADDALKNGIKQGFKYMGVEHYSSVFHASGHLFAGVKKAMTVGIVRSTYGKVKTLVNPVVGGGQISGIGYESRIDRKFKVWDKMVPVVYDILVS